MRFQTYSDAKAFVERARDPLKGRPMTYGWRLVERNGYIAVTVHNAELGRYKPDNTFIITIQPGALDWAKHSISAKAHENTPVAFHRVGVGLYRVSAFWTDREPEYFPGLTLDLNKKEWVNAKPDLSERVDPDKRREWLRALRKWKRNVKVLARLGALESIELDPELYTPYYKQRTKTELLDKVYDMISTGDTSTESLGVMLGALLYGSISWSSTERLDAIERYLKNYSLELRRRFGVFEGE